MSMQYMIYIFLLIRGQQLREGATLLSGLHMASHPKATNIWDCLGATGHRRLPAAATADDLPGAPMGCGQGAWPILSQGDLLETWGLTVPQWP